MKASALRHVHFSSVVSTMDTAREHAAQNPDLWQLITAESQTSGRGTRGRPWISAMGNLYLTVVIPRAALAPARLGLFPLETGLAVHDAAAPLLPPSSRAALRLKWPNDLLWEGRKVAGMLLEATADHVFVGVGINLAYAPEIADGGTPSGRLADAGLDDAAGLPLAKAFAENLRARLSSTQLDSRALITSWRARAQWDKPLRLRDRDGRPQVFPLDLNEEGHLLVRHDDGREEWLVSDYLS
jgi:BirA family transcriptional regulator, biotin operon repressor / biotin---[acetyl-CoA-carboxylase] ligase